MSVCEITALVANSLSNVRTHATLNCSNPLISFALRKIPAVSISKRAIQFHSHRVILTSCFSQGLFGSASWFEQS